VTTILYKQVHEPPPSIVTLCPDLPPAIESVVNRALAKSPDERCSSCCEFVKLLEQVVAQPSSITPQPAIAQGEVTVQENGPAYLRKKAPINQVAWLPDSRHFVVVSSDGVFIHETQTLKQVRFIRINAEVLSIACSPNGRLFAIGLEDGAVSLWEVPGDRKPRALARHKGDVWSLAFSPDGKMLASGSGDKTIRLCDVASGRVLHNFEYAAEVTDLAFSPSQMILASSAGKTVTLQNVLDGQGIYAIEYTDPVYGVAFSPDGKLLAAGLDDGSVTLWDVAAERELLTLSGHADAVDAVAFSPDGLVLASCSEDGTVCLWEVKAGHLKSKRTCNSAVGSVAISPDGKVLLFGDDEGGVQLVDLQDLGGRN